MSYNHDFAIGDSVRLLAPWRGYSAATVVAFEGTRYVIEFTSGATITVYGDELEEA